MCQVPVEWEGQVQAQGHEDGPCATCRGRGAWPAGQRPLTSQLSHVTLWSQHVTGRACVEGGRPRCGGYGGVTITPDVITASASPASSLGEECHR